MKIFSATTRVTFGLTCMAFSVSLFAFMLGMFPDDQAAVIHGRAALCENLGLNCSLFATRNDVRTMKSLLEGLVLRNHDVASAAIRRPDGELLISTGTHAQDWNLAPGHQSTTTQMRVPIVSGNAPWGIVELRFREHSDAGNWMGGHPMMSWCVFSAAATYLMFFMYLRKMLQHLDPSRVIPPRVRQTLDTMAEGLLVLDSQQRILLANRSFADIMGTSTDELTGRNASDLPFDVQETQQKIKEFPWNRAMSQGTPQIGEILTLRAKPNQVCVMKVSATPVYGDDGQQRGALTSFADVTALENHRVELHRMLDALSSSRDEVQRQNIELERLATIDSLTGCHNRRALFVCFENQWRIAAQHGHPLSCIMVDLDHFKSINDTYGHQMGDLVLQRAAEQIRKGRGPDDLVCRYGGEEFCVMLPHTDLDAALIVAEQIRAQFKAADFNGLPVTASFGVSTRSLGAANPQALIDQADKCLYVAKRRGRNCVVPFDQAAREIAEFEKPDTARAGKNLADFDVVDKQRDPFGPFQAVAALIDSCR